MAQTEQTCKVLQDNASSKSDMCTHMPACLMDKLRMCKLRQLVFCLSCTC